MSARGGIVVRGRYVAGATWLHRGRRGPPAPIGGGRATCSAPRRGERAERGKFRHVWPPPQSHRWPPRRPLRSPEVIARHVAYPGATPSARDSAPCGALVSLCARRSVRSSLARHGSTSGHELDGSQGGNGPGRRGTLRRNGSGARPGAGAAGASTWRLGRGGGVGFPVATRGVRRRSASRQSRDVAPRPLANEGRMVQKPRQKRAFALGRKASERLRDGRIAWRRLPRVRRVQRSGGPLPRPWAPRRAPGCAARLAASPGQS